MDYLREGIHLRGFAQIDPLVAYKNEAFELFRDLMNTIWSDFARMIFHVEVEVEGANGNGAGQYSPATSTGGARQITYSGGEGATQPSALAAAAAGAGGAALVGISLLLPHSHNTNETSLLVAVGLATITAAGLARFAARISVAGLQLILALGTVLITVCVIYGGDSASAYPLMYVWV